MAPKLAGHRLTSAVAAVSQTSSETATASWEVRGISMVSKTRDLRTTSPALLEVAGAQFSLDAYWGGKERSKDGYFALYCSRADASSGASSRKRVNAVFQISVVGRGPRRLTRKSTNMHAFPPKGHGTGSMKGWTSFAKFDSLLNPIFRVEDKIIIELKVTAQAGSSSSWQLPAAPGSSSASAASSEPVRAAKEALCGDLGRALASGQDADVEVQGVLQEGESALKAHRLVLAMRSPVFGRMLESGMRESGDGARIVLDDTDQPVVELFVRFLYTGELAPCVLKDQNALCHLLALGHRYEVASLVSLCSSNIRMSDETAVDRLMLSEQLGLQELKTQVLDFICGCRERIRNVQQTDAFARMIVNYPHLTAELLAKITQAPQKRAKRS